MNGAKRERECACCGAKLVEYRHGMSKAMARILQIGWEQGLGDYRLPFKVSDNEAFNYSQRSNFQKLKYWGLVTPDAERKSHWRVTRTGEAFLRGAITVPKYVWTFRGELVGIRPNEEPEMITIQAVEPDWILPDREAYAETARAAADDRQQDLGL